MIYISNQAKEFKDNIANNTAILGIDYGTKRTGFAVSDIRHSISTSLHIVEGKDIFKEIEKISKDRLLGAIVMGYPLQMDGTEGEMAIKIKEIAQKITESFGLPVMLWDERLSSRAVESFFIKQADMTRKKRKENLDSSAAAYILQGALDRLGYL